MPTREPTLLQHAPLSAPGGAPEPAAADTSGISDAIRAARRDRRRTLAALLALQAALVAIGWGWSITQARHHVPLSIGTGVLILLLTAWGTARLVAALDRALSRINRGLEGEVRRRVTQATATRDAIITGLAKLADYRDNETGAHLDRIAAYSALLADRLRAEHPEIDGSWIERLRVASSLHDIGKVGVGDAVLLKPGPLTSEERSAMQRHPQIGADTLFAVRETMGEDALVEMALRVTLYHHERWDGAGYPMRLSNKDIPLEARIVAVADVYDALTSRRVYKDAMPHDDAVRTIESEAGTHFDPQVVRAFLAAAPDFERVRQRFAGGVDAPPLAPVPSV